MNVDDNFWCNDNYYTYIVDGGHDITTGMTDADLSGDYDWVGNTTGFSILTRNTSCDSPALGAGRYGGGKVVFDSGNFSTGAYLPGSDAYVGQLVDYICDNGGVTATEEVTWSSVKSLYR